MLVKGTLTIIHWRLKHLSRFSDDSIKLISFRENFFIWIQSSLKLVPNGPKNDNPALI